MKMRQMTDNTTVPSTAKVAILAALNITDELFQRERQLKETADDQESAVSVLAARIERTLSELSLTPSFTTSPDTLEIEELQQIETSDRT